MTDANEMKHHDADLAEVRAKIDTLDQELLRILNERAALAQAAARAKQAEHGPNAVLYRPEREAQLLRDAARHNPGPLPNADVQRIFGEVVSACRALELPLAVAYLGPQGTFTEAAAIKFFGHNIKPMPIDTIDAVFREVESGTCNFGVVPVENSTEGVVSHTLDTFLQSSLHICGEVMVPVHHCFISSCADLSEIRTVYSHQQSLAQCRKWLDKHYSGVALEPVSSNAEAVRRVMKRPEAAAIAGKIAAEVYAVPVLQENIEDQPDNTTRFLIIGRQRVAASGDDKTAVTFWFTRNRPGGLSHAIEVFASRNIDMTRIESRPMQTQRWNYVFHVDFVGHLSDPIVKEAIAEIQERTDFFKILGSFPRALREEQL